MKKKKLMFFCFGSVHAERRIKVFAEDARFEVIIVSDYNYNFPDTILISLSKKLIQLDSNSFILKKDIFYPFRSLLLLIKIVVTLFQELILVFKDVLIIKLAIKNHKPDLLFFQTLLYPSFLGLFLAKKIPFAITFWNGDLTWYAKNTGLERLFKKYIIKKGIENSTIITVNSNEAQKECLNYKIDFKKIKLIHYPGINKNVFKIIEKRAAKEKTGFTNKHIVFCPRGIGGYFNSNSVIKAAKEVLKDVDDVLFLFLFDKSATNIWKQHQQLMMELNLPLTQFVAIEKLAPTEMTNYYNAADVMVSLSSNDSKPNTMLEAFACGTPVIMGDLPQIREVVSDGVNGFVVDPLNIDDIAMKLKKLLLNKSLRNQFIDYNINLVKEKFDSEKNSEEIKKIIIAYI